MTDDPPPAGATIQFEVDLETARLGSSANLRAKGHVCRVEATELAGRLGGFAIAARKMRLERPAAPST
jgi:hypothetical protein